MGACARRLADGCMKWKGWIHKERETPSRLEPPQESLSSPVGVPGALESTQRGGICRGAGTVGLDLATGGVTRSTGLVCSGSTGGEGSGVSAGGVACGLAAGR